MRPIPKERADDLADQFEWVPSWENSVASIHRIPDEVRRRGIGTQLLAHLLAGSIPAGVPRVRIVNVAHEDGGAIAFLESGGFRKFTSQCEMEMKLG